MGLHWQNRGLVGLVIGMIVVGACGQAVAETGLAACRAVADNTARLACYDRLAIRADGWNAQGVGFAVTDEVTAQAGDVLGFENRDAVLVIALIDDTGAVVQNLHHGGQGEGRHVIAAPGRYRVQVSASGGWAVWLEPGGSAP